MSAGTTIQHDKSGWVTSLTRSYLLADLSTGRSNNFNLLRFLAASLVILSHCSVLAWGQNTEFIWNYMGRLETGGSIGVLIFFASAASWWYRALYRAAG